MTKLCLLMMVGLGLAVLASAAPNRRYSPDRLYNFLHYGTWDNVMLNDNQKTEDKYNDNKYEVQEQNVPSDTSDEESNSDENSKESDSQLRSDSLLRHTSIASDYSSSFAVDPSVGTDPPIIQAAATTIPMPIATTVVAEVPTTVVAPLATTERPIDRGDAPAAPGVNSPQVNVLTTGSSKATFKMGATEKYNPPAEPTPPTVKPTCMTSCPVTYDSVVCGSDGITYISRCVFEAVMCQENNKEVVIIQEGECPTTPPTTPKIANLQPGFMP